MSKTHTGPMFQDTMDPSRVVQPRSQGGRSTTCGIFWKTKQGLVYGGEAEVPSSLFQRDGLDFKTARQLDNIGFVSLHRDEESYQDD